MRPALRLFCFGTPAEVEGVTYARRKFFFSETALQKKFPEFPDTSALAMFNQTGAPEGHPPGRPNPNMGCASGNSGNSGNFSAAREGGLI